MTEGPVSIDREGARAALREVRRSRAAIRRHTINSGLLPALWGLLLLVLLPLYDFLPAVPAAAATAVGAVLVSLVTVWYANSTRAVRPDRAAVGEYLLLFVGCAAVTGLLLIGVGLLVAPHLHHAALVAGPVAAAPLLAGAALMWWRGRP